MGSTNDEEENQVREVEVPCCLNIAAALLQNQVKLIEIPCRLIAIPITLNFSFCVVYGKVG
jgi:hypothetical protein